MPVRLSCCLVGLPKPGKGICELPEPSTVVTDAGSSALSDSGSSTTLTPLPPELWAPDRTQATTRTSNTATAASQDLRGFKTWLRRWESDIRSSFEISLGANPDYFLRIPIPDLAPAPTTRPPSAPAVASSCVECPRPKGPTHCMETSQVSILRS